jgi:hypothetical protein
MVTDEVTMKYANDIHALASNAAPAAAVAPCWRMLEATRRFGNQTALTRRCFR